MIKTTFISPRWNSLLTEDVDLQALIQRLPNIYIDNYQYYSLWSYLYEILNRFKDEMEPEELEKYLLDKLKAEDKSANLEYFIYIGHPEDLSAGDPIEVYEARKRYDGYSIVEPNSHKYFLNLAMSDRRFLVNVLHGDVYAVQGEVVAHGSPHFPNVRIIQRGTDERILIVKPRVLAKLEIREKSLPQPKLYIYPGEVLLGDALPRGSALRVAYYQNYQGDSDEA